MRILEAIQIIEPYAALYLPREGAICIADLHLGYEEALAEEIGMTLPTTQLSEVERTFKSLMDSCEADHLIINGDLKHVFARSTPQEWAEVPAFIEFALQKVEKITLVRGNHDTLLGPLKRFSKVEVVAEHHLGDIVFVHGHKDYVPSSERTIIIGHEHPVLVLGDTVGARVRVPTFLQGKIDGKNLIVMPAFSPLAGGTEINLACSEELLSPILRRVDIGKMVAYAIDPEAGILKFPELKKWREVSLRL
ncbi:MAG: metallophosphoesterase [Methanocellales archaeon]|nr:metallophosphoesterase [Methanocellales archaeon]MDD3291219.1 metallophosphoesterase [Methanocellales archaeon]MDD5235319.1 metallophosphoesterase [Methanocellales archaeon]MDD5484525.1 metallophosphoesterase [Methanocellales archaeon]